MPHHAKIHHATARADGHPHAATHPPTWRQMNADTSPEAEAVLLRLWSRDAARDAGLAQVADGGSDGRHGARAGAGRAARPLPRRAA